jgi:hypothetical protein
VTLSGNYQPGTDRLGFTNTSAETFGNLAAEAIIAADAFSLALYSEGGTATIAQWQAALRAVTFTSTAAVPSTASRTVSFVVSDGVQLSNTVTRTVTVTATNQSPVVTPSSGATLFASGGNAVAVDPDLTLSDTDHQALEGAFLTITDNQGGGEYLALTTDPRTMGNIAASYAELNGVPTLVLASAGRTATIAEWQAALRAVVYFAADSLSPRDRAINIRVSDGISSSVVKTKTVAVRRVPVITWTPAALTAGTALGAGQLNASATFNGAPVAGAFTYAPASGAVLAVGTPTLNAAFTPTDTATYVSATASASLTVNPAPTTVVVTPASATFTGASQTLLLSARVTSAGGPVNAGTVTFSVRDRNGREVGAPVTSGTVTNGNATASYVLPANAAPGDYTVLAGYNAAGSFAASGDVAASLGFAGANTATIVTADSRSDGFRLRATVTSTPNTAGVVGTGTVTFTVRDSAGRQVGTPVTSGAPVNGTASVTFPLPANSPPGEYVVTAAYNAAGNFASSTGTVTAVLLPVARLANLSVRATVVGGQTITQGFVTSGPLRLLARAIGPGLTPFGVPGAVQSPSLALLDGKGRLLVSNSGWSGESTLAAAFVQAGAFGLAPTSRDAAAIAEIAAGTYALQASGGGGAGQILAELYALPASTALPEESAEFINFSVLGPVNGSDALVAGLVVQGNAPGRVLLRGIGPSLGQFGVPSPLTTPLLRVYDGRQTLIAQNQNWGTPVTVIAAQPASTPVALAAAAAAAGAFPLATGSADSSVVVMLAPGSYTVQLTGAGIARGTGLLEIYILK